MVQKELAEVLEKIVAGYGLSGIKVSVSITKDASHGDYATNIALILGKQVGRNPMELAEEMKGKIETGKRIEKVEVRHPGFINFFVEKEELVKKVSRMLTNKEKLERKAQKTVVVEFTDANPFKEMHIGHLFSNVVGESICRLLESQGYNVKRVCYQGDVGMHVAKSIWGLQQLISETPNDNASAKAKVEFLGKAYAFGAKQFEEDEAVKQEITLINKQIYANDPQIMELYQKGKKWSLDYFDGIYKRLGTYFDHFYFESEVAQKGMEYVKEHIKDGVFEESQGAIVFNGEKYGMHTRVFINSQGLPTYEAKELALAPTKFEDYHYDQSIIITGNEINEYFNVMLKVLSLINPDLAKKTKHFSHGMLRLSTGKISSRKGNVPTAEGLINQAVNEGKKITEMNDTLAEQVGLGAIKYALLKNGIGKDISFDFSEAVSFEGNAGPYLQYTYVRSMSILQKNKENIGYDLNLETYTFSQEESELLRTLSYYSEIVEQAGEQFSPHLVATYLFELAQKFNLFYQKDQILKAADEQKKFRLFLVSAMAHVMKNGLFLLGIESPERM